MQEQKEHCHCGHHQNEHHHEGEHCCGEGHHHQKGHSQGPEISCGCGHCQEEHCEQGEEMTLKKIIIALVLFVLGIVLEHTPYFETLLGELKAGNVDLHRALYMSLYGAAYILAGKDVVKSALWNIMHGEIFDEQFLMTVASLGAIFVGEAGEAVAVMLFYNIGEYFQDKAVDKSRDSISALMNIRPDRAFVVREGKVIEAAPEDIKPGEVIEVKPGERVALDGVICEGESFMDTSALTGESVPGKFGAGETVLAGFVNQNAVVRIEVTKEYGKSAVARILELTEEASEVKAKSEKFITRFAKIYTPVVCFSALAVAVIPPLALKYFAPELFVQWGWSVWIYRALTFLVVSCPCALVISVPLSFFSGMGAASRHGILVKGSNFMEALSKVETAVFDKTGTLTKGIFAVNRVFAEPGVDEDQLIAVAAHAEHFSNHPVSKSIKAAHVIRSGKDGKCECCEKIIKTEAEEIAGAGVKILLDGKTVLAGNEKLMTSGGVKMADGSEWKKREELAQSKIAGTLVYVACDGKYLGCIVISDEVKEDSFKAVSALKKAGVKNTVMLTGDNEETAALIGETLGLDKVYANLLPQDKVSRLEELLAQKSRKGTLIFTGDGVNDSPVLARADVGIAMGGLGSDAAIEAADVVIMDDNPIRLPEVIKIARSTMSVVSQNILFSIGVKVAIMVLSAIGIGNMWIAVFGDVGVTLLAVLNSMRILKK